LAQHLPTAAQDFTRTLCHFRTFETLRAIGGEPLLAPSSLRLGLD
jgi:hypothetical protein